MFNRTVNPVVRAVLRSPLHRFMSGRLAVITVTGRRSGRELSFPVSYERVGERVTIAAGLADQKLWWRNLTGAGAPVRLRLRGQDRIGHAMAREDAGSGVTVTVDLEPAAPPAP